MPFLFSNSSSIVKIQNENRSHSEVPKNLVSEFIRHNTAKPIAGRYEINDIPEYKHRNLFATAYTDMTCNTRVPRPVSTVPDRSVVAFSTQKIRDPLEPSCKQLYKEYKIQKAISSAVPRQRKDEKVIKETKEV